METTDAEHPGNPCDDPYRPPVAFARNPDSDTLCQADLRKLLRADERRALAWFGTFIVAFLTSSMLRIAGTSSSAWDTWMINWQSNLCLYASALSLLFSIRFGLRSASTLRQLKDMEFQKTDSRQ